MEEARNGGYYDYGKIALLLTILIIGIWFVSHFRIAIIPVNKVDSIVHTQHYTCPAVPDTISIGNFLGCEKSYVDEHIDSKVLKLGVVFYWV